MVDTPVPVTPSTAPLPPPQHPQPRWQLFPYILALVVCGLVVTFSLANRAATKTTNYLAENASCDSYTKNTYNYGNCKLQEYSTKTVYTSDPIDCSEMYVYADDCARLQIVQRAIKTKESNLCNSLQDTNQFPLCIGQFPDTAVWEQGCKTVMDTVLTKGNFAPQLVTGRCLTRANANLTVSRSGLGRIFDSWGEYEDSYRQHYAELGRTNDIYAPQAPVWFTNWGTLDSDTADYLTSINADPNNTDDFGRTAAVLFVEHLSYLVSNRIDQFAPDEQGAAVDKELEPLKILIRFGVDPEKKDIMQLSAADYASRIENDILRRGVLDLFGSGSTNSRISFAGWTRFDQPTYGFAFMYPDSLVLGRSVDDYTGARWVSFNNRDEPLSSVVSVIVSSTSTQLKSTSNYPLYDNCVVGRQLLVSFPNQQMTPSILRLTRNGAPLERLTQKVDGEVQADFLIAKTDDTCIVIRAMGPGYGKDGVNLGDIDKMFASFIITK